jgi:hypothetical protein
MIQDHGESHSGFNTSSLVRCSNGAVYLAEVVWEAIGGKSSCHSWLALFGED